MLIRIHHHLRWSYGRAVYIEPTSVRLTPRQDATQRLLEHTITIDPTPSGDAWAIEPDGVNARSLWFSGEHESLSINAVSLVETLRDNPFDAIVTHEGALSLPATQPPALARALRPWLEGGIEPDVNAWAQKIADDSGRTTLSFLNDLTTLIHAEFNVISRLDGDPFTPQQTLQERRGACRDLTILFMAACRSLGLPARFVSGYSIHNPPESTHDELHAWAEIHLPGGGWRGWDPTLGLAVADGHVALASGPDHELAAPMSGTYRGTGVSGTMEYDVKVTVESATE